MIILSSICGKQVTLSEQASIYNVVHKVAFQGEYKYEVHVFPQGQYTLSLGKHHNRKWYITKQTVIKTTYILSKREPATLAPEG